MKNDKTVGFAEGREHGLAIPRDERAQVHDLDLHALDALHFGLIQRPPNTHAPRYEGHVGTFAGDECLSEWRRIRTDRDRTFLGAIEVFVLEEEHRIRVGDGSADEPFRIFGRSRYDHLEPRYVAKPGFRALRMKRPGADSPTKGGAYRDVEWRIPSIVRRCKVVDDLIEPTGDKIGVLHFYDRF